jgi:kynureninase
MSAAAEARALDARDPLRRFRSRFHVPKGVVYLCGNSLGLQPIAARKYVDRELSDWARLGVEGHHKKDGPWVSYHELVTSSSARLVGAKPAEVVVMNTLTVNLHLMLVSFYRPTRARHKIIVEKNAFPSDRYAVASQARFHGYDPRTAVVEAEGDALETIERRGREAALVLIGNVNYLTGRAYDMKAIVNAARKAGCAVGFDLAHGAGNLALSLHDDGPDFAVWCGYKYLNAGPGSLSGCFVHERHARARLPRFEGWWGTNKKKRFLMEPGFDALPGAEGWQLSNPPILQLAALRASLEIFDEAGMPALRRKSEKLTGYLESMLRTVPGVEILTPKERGCQLSLRMKEPRASLRRRLAAARIICDFREPDIVRVAPVPLYNTFEDCWRLARALSTNSPQWRVGG